MQPSKPTRNQVIVKALKRFGTPPIENDYKRVQTKFSS